MDDLVRVLTILDRPFDEVALRAQARENVSRKLHGEPVWHPKLRRRSSPWRLRHSAVSTPITAPRLYVAIQGTAARALGSEDSPADLLTGCGEFEAAPDRSTC